jgi:DNA ligase-1
MAKRENLMLAHVWNPAKHGVAGWMMSEKLDGMRCFWDGGISRGQPCRNVPYANTEKDHRLVEEPIATGLWSRYFKVIHAPDWWIDRLPNVPLDGELYSGNFQDVMSFVKKFNPIDGEWQQVQYRVFDKPSLRVVLGEHYDWVKDHDDTIMDFEQAYAWLMKHHPELTHEQIPLSFSTAEALEQIDEKLFEICDRGGEGLMLRKRSSIWTPQRSHELLKVKKFLDAEAEVIGYTSGRLTDRGSKLLGMIGALIVRFGKVTFELSGMTEEEREFEVGSDWAAENPGSVCPDHCQGRVIKIGDTIRFKYRELTRDGVPKEARVWRD